MRPAPELREGSRERKTFLFRPPDPVWSSTPHMAAVRESLLGFDSRVTVWWAANRGRWRLMEWSHAGGFWRPVCFWQGPAGEYREADGEAMIAHLGRMAISAKDVVAKVEAHNAKVEAEKGKAFREANIEYMTDITERAMGIRQTFAPGVIRSRDWLKGERGGSHRKMLRQHFIDQWELRNGRKWYGP